MKSKDKSTRRLGYDVQRKLERVAGGVEKKRRKLNDDPEPSRPRKKKNDSRSAKSAQNSRLGDREDAEVDEQSLGKEIEGTGAGGLGGISEDEQERRRRQSEISVSGGGRVSGLAGRIASKRSTQRSR